MNASLGLFKHILFITTSYNIINIESLIDGKAWAHDKDILFQHISWSTSEIKSWLHHCAELSTSTFSICNGVSNFISVKGICQSFSTQSRYLYL